VLAKCKHTRLILVLCGKVTESLLFRADVSAEICIDGACESERETASRDTTGRSVYYVRGGVRPSAARDDSATEGSSELEARSCGDNGRESGARCARRSFTD
jgi:hypothetical protein